MHTLEGNIMFRRKLIGGAGASGRSHKLVGMFPLPAVKP